MKLGRNAPCHCGSGKKYKVCCLSKDEESRHLGMFSVPAALAPQAATLPPVPPRPADPHIEALNARWEAFEANDYEGRMALFDHTLDEPELLDGEMAFAMLDKLFQATVAHHDRGRFDTLVDSLRTRRPEIYDEEAHYCLNWLITNALVARRYDRVPALANEMAARAGKDIDMWNRVENLLVYHGQLAVLVEAMRLGWPLVRQSEDVVPWGQEEFAQRAISYELLAYAESTPTPVASDPALLARLHVYDREILPERVEAYLAHLTGQAQRPWTMDDFAFAPPSRRSRSAWDEEDDEAAEQRSSASPAVRNFYDLSIAFLGYLHRVEGVPYSRGEMGRRELERFIFERHAGDLEYRENILESLERSQPRRQRQRLPPISKFRPYAHPLVPDHERLDRYLGGRLALLNQLYEHAAAFFALLPSWLRFLESHHLIDAALRVRTLHDLEELAESLCQACGHYVDDPTPQQALLGWRVDAARVPSR